jgi:phage-related protein
MKRLAFLGGSRNDLSAFPAQVKLKAGFNLWEVQRGREPKDWKPMNTVGPGVKEIRIMDASGAFRVVYVATFADAVFVLHVFHKKSQRTPSHDIEVARARFKELARRMAR